MFKNITAIILVCTGSLAHAEEARISDPEMGLKDAPVRELSQAQRLIALKHVLCGDFKINQPLPSGDEKRKLWMAQNILCAAPSDKPDSLR